MQQNNLNQNQYKFSICAAQANSNEIVLASTHDVQELDISALLAAQSFIWIGEEYDRESKRQDYYSPDIVSIQVYCEAVCIIPVHKNANCIIFGRFQITFKRRRSGHCTRQLATGTRSRLNTAVMQLQVFLMQSFFYQLIHHETVFH